MVINTNYLQVLANINFFLLNLELRVKNFSILLLRTILFQKIVSQAASLFLCLEELSFPWIWIWMKYPAPLPYNPFLCVALGRGGSESLVTWCNSRPYLRHSLVLVPIQGTISPLLEQSLSNKSIGEYFFKQTILRNLHSFLTKKFWSLYFSRDKDTLQ